MTFRVVSFAVLLVWWWCWVLSRQMMTACDDDDARTGSGELGSKPRARCTEQARGETESESCFRKSRAAPFGSKIPSGAGAFAAIGRPIGHLICRAWLHRLAWQLPLLTCCLPLSAAAAVRWWTNIVLGRRHALESLWSCCVCCCRAFMAGVFEQNGDTIKL